MAHPKPPILSLLMLSIAVLACAEEDPLDGGPAAGARCLLPATLIGQPCTQDFHCQRGASCFASACRTEAADAGACETTADCADGLYCNCSRATCKFKTGTCHKPGTLQTGDACSHHKSCKSGICNTYQGDTCQDPAEEGKGCADHDQCKAGLVCSKKEQKCRTPFPEGQACTERWECQKELDCQKKQGQMVCAKTIGKRFTGCLTNNHQVLAGVCGGDFVCNLARGYCDLPAADGEACSGPRTCATGLVCNLGYSPPKCQAKSVRVSGEPCSGEAGDRDDDCQAGLLCINKTCSQPSVQDKGELCRITAECSVPYKCPVEE